MNGAAATGIEPFTPGPAVRPDYLNLPRDLSALTRCFGMSLTPGHQRDSTTLVFAIECTDRLLDDIPDIAGRTRFCANVMARLRGDIPTEPDLAPELIARLGELKEMGERRHIHPRLSEMADELLVNSEQMRMATSNERFIDCAVNEGQLMVGMLLLILEDISTTRFDAFMRQLSEPANLVDKLRDARRDFQNGEIVVKPTLFFHLRLLRELFLRTAGLARRNLMNWRLAGWGVRSLFTELAGFSVSKSHSYIGKRSAYAIVPSDHANECAQTMGW